MLLTAKTIIVSNLAVDISIGVHAHERAAPQRLLVSVEANVASLADEGDRLAGTLDYDLLCDFIRALASHGHFDLQETVARRVLEFVLDQPSTVSATVETRKPDIFPDCDYVAVRLTAARR